MKRTAYITVRLDTEGDSEKSIREAIKFWYPYLQHIGSASWDNPRIGQIRLVRPSHRAKKVKNGN